MAITVNDIARAAGVSRTTVLRALGDRDDINSETKARVKQIAEEFRYRPNRIARSLALGESHLVGVVASPGEWARLALEAIEHHLHEAGYSMLFKGYPRGERLSFEHLIQNRVAGVIVLPRSTDFEPEPYQELIDANVKLVIVDNVVENVKVPQIMIDHYQAARLATEHLIYHGHRRIAHLTLAQSVYAGRQRAQGFLDAMTAAKIEVPPEAIMQVPPDESFGELRMQEILRRDECPTAVVAHHDLVAIGAMRAVFAAGLSIPEDIAIIGNGDMWCAGDMRVPLTSVRHPVRQMFELGIQKLLTMLAGSEVEPKITTLDVDLVIRESCGCHAG